MDMTKWANAKRFASWLGLSPNNRITGGKVISCRTKASANRAGPLRQRPGHVPELEEGPNGSAPKAVTATAHKLTKLVYSMLRYGQAYVDAGAEYYESQYHHRALRAAKLRVPQLGYQLGHLSNAQDQVAGVPLNPVAAS